MSAPLVSIVIPVYNVEQYLKQCLDSVVNQSYPNIEVIAVNDGSTDNSLQILKEYETYYKNIRVYSQENKGQSVARNLGISKAKGKYIQFMDSDDYIDLNTIKRLVNKMTSHDLDLIRFAANSFTDNESAKFNMRDYDFSLYFDENTVYNKKDFLNINLKAFTASPALYIIKREILLDKELLFKPSIIHEDELFTTVLFLNIDKVMYDPTPYYKRRYREGSTMTLQSKEHLLKSFDSRVIVLKELIKLLETYNRTEERKLIFERIKENNRLIVRNDNISLSKKKNAFKTIYGWTIFHFYVYYVYSLIKAVMNKIKRELS